MSEQQKHELAVKALARFERAYTEFKFITVDDLRLAAEAWWAIERPGETPERKLP